MAGPELTVYRYERDFTSPITQPRLFLEPVRYSWHAIGGPERASIEVTGSLAELWEIINWLRCPIEILDGYSRVVWYGYIASVEVRVGTITAGVSLDQMANKVAVAYSKITGGASSAGSRATTSFSSDADSVAAYGTRELLVSGSKLSDDAATKLRDQVLASQKYPIPTVHVSGDQTLSGRIECRGWYSTLGWRYYSAAALKISYDTVAAFTGTTLQNIGNVAATEKAAQSFLTGTAQVVESVQVYVRKAAAPADNLTLRLETDSGGSPSGSAVTGSTVTVAGSGLDSTISTWQTFTFAAPVSLSAATTYWIVLYRSGALDITNYYQLEKNAAAGYADGVLKALVSSVWTVVSPAADALFRVNGSVETTQQIADIETSIGEFLIGSTIENASGIYSSPYRNGDTLALDEVEALLKQGTTSGLRLLTTVTYERLLRLYVEPTRGASDYSVMSDGRLFDNLDLPAPKWTCPVAVWCRLKDVVPANVDVTKLADLSAFFIERSEFDARTQMLALEPKNVPSPQDLAQVRQG